MNCRRQGSPRPAAYGDLRMFVMGLPYISPPVSPPMSPPLDPDASLIAGTLAGDREAFARLVARHRDGVFSFARHVVGNEADAQDLAQETFVRAYTALSRFREGSRFEPWLYTIAANLCRSHLRKARWRFLSLESAAEAAAHGGDPAATALRRDQDRRLHAAIQALPAEQRIIVVLRHLRGHAYGEIAEIVGLPVSTVEHRLRAARKVLRGALDEEPVAGGMAR